MAQHIGLRNSVRLLEAIEKKIAEVGDDPTLGTARREAQKMIDEAKSITPEQRALLTDFIRGVLMEARVPAVGYVSED